MSEDEIEIRHIAPRLTTFNELVESILHCHYNLEDLKQGFNITLESTIQDLVDIIENGWKRERESE